MQIHSAVYRGDTGEVLSRLRAGADVEAVRSGHTPLMRAVVSRNAGVGMLELLLAHGADVNAVSSNGLEETPLRLAAKSGGSDKVRFLLRAGARPGFTTSQGYNALIAAAHSFRADQMDVIKLLLEAGTDPNSITTYHESAVGVCSLFGRFEAVRLLLDAGARPDPLRWTPLMRAIALGSVEDVAKHLAAGGDLEARDRYHRTPWLLCIQAGEVRKAELLRDAGARTDDHGLCGRPALLFAAGEDHVELLEWLISHGSDVNISDDYAHTPLMEAAERGAAGCIAALIRAGADVHAADHVQSQAINRAANAAVAGLLVGAGADPDHVDGTGYSLLHRAAEDGDEALTRALLEMGASPDPAEWGQPLHKAVAMDEPGVARLLLQAGADPNARDGDGWTPLMFARSAPVVRELLSHGADPRLTDEIGRTAREIYTDPELQGLLGA